MTNKTDELNSDWPITPKYHATGFPIVPYTTAIPKYGATMLSLKDFSFIKTQHSSNAHADLPRARYQTA